MTTLLPSRRAVVRSVLADLARVSLRSPRVPRHIRWLARLTGFANQRIRLQGFSVNIRGQRLFADSLDRILAALLWKYRLLGDLETRLMKQFVANGMVAVDIGANIGYYTLVLATSVGSDGTVYAFEPEPRNFNQLARFISVNGHRNIKAFQSAVSDRSGPGLLFLSEQNGGDHRIYDRSGLRESLEIDNVALDEVLAQLPRVDFIKMDIQGAEMRALLGMRELVGRSRGMKMICEFWPAALEMFGVEPGEFLSKLDELGFSVAYINEEECCVQRLDRAELLSMCEGGEYVSLWLERG